MPFMGLLSVRLVLFLLSMTYDCVKIFNHVRLFFCFVLMSMYTFWYENFWSKWLLLCLFVNGSAWISNYLSKFFEGLLLCGRLWSSLPRVSHDIKAITVFTNPQSTLCLPPPLTPPPPPPPPFPTNTKKHLKCSWEHAVPGAYKKNSICKIVVITTVHDLIMTWLWDDIGLVKAGAF